jgi:nicotinate-nucleotide adenylyltransferase
VHVALIGGSFNPPHVGHLWAATYVRAVEPVDEVWLMPALHHPFGKALISFEHRLAMCERLCRDAPTWLKAVDVERQAGGQGWTVETLAFLRQRHPDWAFSLVIGSDILQDLPSWREFDRIKTMAQVLVIQRAGHPSDKAKGPPMAEISSSEIRADFAAGRRAEDRVPRSVLAYIEANHLYGL